MQWYELIFEVIDMRSFSNLWFWIALAVMWSTASHWVLGVPFDMITRARRAGGSAQDDVETLTRINVNRLLNIARVSGTWIVGFAFFMLTMLTTLGFYYEQEFAQAVLCLLAPMSVIFALSIRTAALIEKNQYTGDDLYRQLMKHRMVTQGIGMVSILVTSMWGMFQNINFGAI